MQKDDVATPRAQAKHFITQVLTHNVDAKQFGGLYRDVDWHQVLSISGDSLVTPSLYVELRRLELLGYVPDDPREALAWIHDANVQRNDTLLAVWTKLAGVLCEAGVQCLPLKGIAMLQYGLYPHSDRVLADIDFLVDDSQLSLALCALSKAGYRQMSNVNDPESVHGDPEFYPLDPDDFRNQAHNVGYQFPVILPPDEDIVLELHYRVGEGEVAAHLQSMAQALLGNKGDDTAKQARCAELDELLVATIFYHAHLKDLGHVAGMLDLRRLLDIERLLDAGADVNGVLRNLRQHFAGSDTSAALASFVHSCAQMWPHKIARWRDMDATELYGVAVFKKRQAHPMRSRIALAKAQFRRRALLVVRPGSLKSLYGDRGSVIVLLRLLRYGAFRLLRWAKRSVS